MAKRKIETNFGFGSSTARFNTLGLHPELTTFNDSNPLGPGQYHLKRYDCPYKKKTACWKKLLESEEFSKFLGFRNPKILKERQFRRSVGGPGTYDLIVNWVAAAPTNTGFGKDQRFRSFIKHDQPPPGTHNLKIPRTKFTTTPTFEWDGIQSRFKNPEPNYRKAPNRYNLPHECITDKIVSKRGPYDCFTGPRDNTTIKNHFAPPLFRPPDQFFVIASEMDKLLHHKRKKLCGKFLLEERFPENMTIKATKNGFTMYERDQGYPGPAEYDLTKTGGIRKLSESLRPFNSSNVHARPPTNWRIHPGPDRYAVKPPRCMARGKRQSWMFKTKYTRDLVRVESYSNFTFN